MNRSLPFFRGAESPANNHYLLNSLPSSPTECRKGVWRDRNNYLGLKKTKQKTKKNSERITRKPIEKEHETPPHSTRLLPHVHAPHTHTHTLPTQEMKKYTIIHYSYPLYQKKRFLKIWDFQNRHIYLQPTANVHTYTRTSFIPSQNSGRMC